MWYSEGVRIRDAGRGGLRFCVTQFGDREIGGKSHGQPCSHMTVTVSRFSCGPIGIAVTCIHVPCGIVVASRFPSVPVNIVVTRIHLQGIPFTLTCQRRVFSIVVTACRDSVVWRFF